MTPERWRQVDSLFHAALEQAPERRASFLDQACRSDRELRREVESLLNQDGSGRTLLERPAWEMAPDLIDDATRTGLTTGMQLGPYQIEGPLGAGGMGRVYSARDTRLGRAVAIKVVAEQFSGRFAREARAISALNHPHICTLHDVGPNYLVMERVEGETLAARLKKGALPAELVLRYGAQIADALAAAHARGIIHRDLKPANIMITKSGVKVLDFGLAKTYQEETLTASQAIMGTPAYMAPEQREGKECDARTDIYALGLVLFEMAAGRRIEPGQPPAISALPSELARIVERSIAADPEDRWQAAKDVKAVLEWASQSPAAPVAAIPRRLGIAFAAIALVAVVVAGVSWQWSHGTRSGPLRPLIRLEGTIPADTPLASNSNGGLLALSPDGSRLALTLRVADGKVRLYTRALQDTQLTPLAGTENAFSPFFSPDGQWIGFFADGKLKKVPSLGGGVITLADVVFSPTGASWGDDGNIIMDKASGFGASPPMAAHPLHSPRPKPPRTTWDSVFRRSFPEARQFCSQRTTMLSQAITTTPASTYSR